MCEYDGQLIKSEKRNKPKRPSGPPQNGIWPALKILQHLLQDFLRVFKHFVDSVIESMYMVTLFQIEPQFVL